MFLRKLGKFIRGNVSAFQITLACLLGGITGFLPGFDTAPFLWGLLFTVLLIFNANLVLFGASFLLLSLLGLLLVPVTFQVGILLLEGPLSGLFGTLINAPVTAWMGFEIYLVSGGLLLGALAGLVLGLLVASLLRRLQRFLAGLEESSERFRKLSGQFWFRAVMFIFFGGIKGKRSFKEIVEEGTKGSVIRPVGAVAVAGLIALLFIGSLFLDERIAREVLRTQLEKANGATVDLESFKLETSKGRLAVTGLALADSSNLERNLFSADSLEADLGVGDLLSKRFTINSLVIDGARSGDPRKVPGQRVEKAPKQKDKEKDSKLPEILTKPGETTVEDVVQNFPEWKRRLTQLKSWLDRSTRSDEVPVADDQPRLRDRLREQARLLGYHKVRATHLVKGSPTLTIEDIRVNPLTLAELPGERFSIEGSFLSTQPNLLEEAPALLVQSESDRIRFSFSGAGLAAIRGANQLNFHYREIPISKIKDLAPDNVDIPISEGLVSVESREATLDGSILDIPLQIRIVNADIRIDEKNRFKLDSVDLPARVSGPVNAPRLTMDPSAFQKVLQNALADTAKEMVGDKIKEELGDEFGKEIEKVLPGGLDSLFKKKKD